MCFLDTVPLHQRPTIWLLLSSSVPGEYFYTMRAVGGTDELQVAIDKFDGLHIGMNYKQPWQQKFSPIHINRTTKLGEGLSEKCDNTFLSWT
ncbi:hypothetical protein Pfo_003605 [Paulownia fortunei]|nr:hypothetical protein Pfo_003605 [Paulownia fortunei]